MTEEEVKIAIKKFKSNAMPSNPNESNPATVKDLKKLIDETANLFKILAIK